jgi:hypothetical protein
LLISRRSSARGQIGQPEGLQRGGLEAHVVTKIPERGLGGQLARQVAGVRPLGHDAKSGADAVVPQGALAEQLLQLLLQRLLVVEARHFFQLFFSNTLPPSSMYIFLISAGSRPMASAEAIMAPVLVPPMRSK